MSLENMAFSIYLLGFFVFSNSFHVAKMISLDLKLQPTSWMLSPTICLMVMMSCLTMLWFSEEQGLKDFFELSEWSETERLSSSWKVDTEDSISSLASWNSETRSDGPLVGVLKVGKKSRGANSMSCFCVVGSKIFIEFS